MSRSSSVAHGQDPCLLGITLAACGGIKAPTEQDHLEAIRNTAKRSSDGEVVGQWLLSELISKGGDVARAREARAKLDKLPHDGMYAALSHRHRRRGPRETHFGRARLPRARQRPRAHRKTRRAPLIAWFSTNHVLGLAPNTSDLWQDGAATAE